MAVQTGIDNQTADGNMGTLATLAMFVLGVGTVMFFLPILGSVIMFIVVTCMVIIIILLLRKAIIVLLVVASPIAFVMYLLPNTEKYFQKWLSMFWKLLLVFPVVGLLFGGGQLASAIILVSGTSAAPGQKTIYQDDTQKCIELPSNAAPTNTPPNTPPGTPPAGSPTGTSGGARIGPCAAANSTPIMLGLTAAGIAVAPLLAVYSVLKGALAAAGAVNGAVQNLGNKAIASRRKRLTEDTEALSKRRQLAAMNNKWSPSNVVTLGAKRRKGFRDYARRSVEQELNYKTSEEAAKKAQESEAYQRQLAGGSRFRPFSGVEDDAIERAVRRAEFTLDKAEIEEVTAMSATIDKLGLTGDQIKQLAQGMDITTQDGTRLGGKNARKAAFQKLAQQSDISGLQSALQAGADRDMGGFMAKTIEQNWSGIKAKGAHITTGNTLDSLRNGAAVDLNSSMQEAMRGMDANLLSTQKSASLNLMNSNMAAGGDSAAAAKAAAQALLDPANAQILAKVDLDRRSTIQQIGT